MLTDNVKENQHSEWLARFRECDKIEHEKIIKKDLYPEKPGLTMGEVIRMAAEKTRQEAILVTDVGQHQMIASRYFKQNSKSIFSSGREWVTMGFGLRQLFSQLGAPTAPWWPP
jgi:acetolactate synthase-1/2/3 large subunit